MTESGDELGDPTSNAKLREFAAKQNLPIAELVVRPVEFSAEPARLHEYSPDRFSVIVNSDGRSLVMDVLHSPSRILKGGEDETSGYYTRVRLLDGYGQAGNDVSDPAELTALVSELKKLLPTITNESMKKGVLTAIEKYTAIT